LHTLSAKAERLLWHQRLAHCGDEQLCRAHMLDNILHWSDKKINAPILTCFSDTKLAVGFYGVFFF